MNLKKQLLKAQNIKIGIIGDIMLDIYWVGHAHRISPEAPIPIVLLNTKKNRAGGAANVALNCKVFSKNIALFSVIGDDDSGKNLLDILNEQGINTQGIIKIKTRPTTEKIRIMAQHHQITRVDNEVSDFINSKTEKDILIKFEHYIKGQKPDIIILQDYNKGVLTPHLIKAIIHLCNLNKIPTVVDPKKENFLAYQNSTIFKPNFSEIITGLSLSSKPEINEKSLAALHDALKKKLHHQLTVITLSEKGIFYHSGIDKKILPTTALNVSDVSGAGDTVVALLAVFYAASHNLELACYYANIGAGLVCAEIGTSVVNLDHFINALKK